MPFKGSTRWPRLLGAVGLMSLLSVSCIYDADSRCAPHQHLSSNSSCTCDDGLVLQGQVCVPCGENETWQSGVCVCSVGFTRATDGSGACIMGGIGSPCDLSASDNECDAAPYTVCRDHGEGAGYCTATCAANSDCPHGYTCDTTSIPATCKSAAVGQGDSCQTSDDCAGKDANYCENTLTHLCIVVGCSVESPLSCSEGFSCCDVHSLGLALTLCVPEGQCPTAK